MNSYDCLKTFRGCILKSFCFSELLMNHFNKWNKDNNYPFLFIAIFIESMEQILLSLQRDQHGFPPRYFCFLFQFLYVSMFKCLCVHVKKNEYTPTQM